MSQSEQPVADSKWVKGLSVEQSLPDAAHRIVQSRLAAVLYWLPLAAEKSDEDVEYVHQLRVSTRRAVEALRVFAGLIPQESGKDLRGKLSQVRQAAGEARIWMFFVANWCAVPKQPARPLSRGSPRPSHGSGKMLNSRLSTSIANSWPGRSPNRSTDFSNRLPLEAKVVRSPLSGSTLRRTSGHS